MTTHHLKIQRQPFADLVSGRKTGEVRNCADREFREGDQVELFLMDETGNPANKSIVRTITHIQRGYGLSDDICVLSYAAPVADRKPDAIIEGVMTSCGISHAIYASTVSLKHGEQVKLFALPPDPVPADAAKAFAKGFNTLEQAGGKYRINMQFANGDEEFAAYTELGKLNASIAKPL